jgi:hypothetical protein
VELVVEVMVPEEDLQELVVKTEQLIQVVVLVVVLVQMEQQVELAVKESL